MVNHNYRTP